MNKTSIIAQLNRLDTDRLKAYRQLLDFYHGRQWTGRERRGEKRLTFNYTKVFIDKITSYLMSGISFVVEAEEDTDEAKARARRAEAALQQVYEENNLEQLDLETETDCAIMGDASYKTYKGMESGYPTSTSQKATFKSSFGDSSDYAYGSDHPVFEVKYSVQAAGLNRLQVEGYDPSEEEPILVDAFAWEEIERLYDRLGRLEDRNIDSVAAAEGGGNLI